MGRHAPNVMSGAAYLAAVITKRFTTFFYSFFIRGLEIIGARDHGY
jgi:hypothetical protein